MKILSVCEKKKGIDVIRYIASMLFLLSLWGCGTSEEANHNPMFVDIDARHDVSFFDIFERIELIPLETTDESIFRDIDRLIYHDGVLYIQGAWDERRVFAFDLTGKFRFKINDWGQGPASYLHIADFEIDRQRNKLLVLDPIARNLLEYDLNGRFVHRTRLPEIINAYNQLKCLGDGIIAFWTFDGSNRLKFYDRNLNSIFSEHLPAREGSILDHFEPRAFSHANFLIREAALDNNIYEFFSDGTYSVAYTWDFGRLNNCETITRNLPGRISSPEEAMEFRRLMERMDAGEIEIANYFFQRIGGNQTYRYAQIRRRNQTVHLLHNIAEKHTRVFTEFSEGATFFPIFWSDEFVIGLGPFAGYNEDTIPDAILDERNLAIKRNICEFDNPVLIKYWFRR